ncbi:hypothetical protein HGA88_00010 [Candidatus Roizmanbacteria bacterium]|nr:hypothetical protein [Candidatus Roizmanbacteria bacterium]
METTPVNPMYIPPPRTNPTNDIQSQSGQVLLIVVMLVATVITVVTSVAFKSTTETQVSKLQEESQKSLAAAESAIEAALAQSTATTLNVSSIPNLSDYTGSVVITTQNKTEFSTPLLTPDQQYTFYLSDYPGLSAHVYSGNLVFYFASEGSGDCTSRSRPALEVTLISLSNIGTHYLVEPCSSGLHINGTTDVLSSSAISAGTAIDGSTYSYKTATLSVSNTKLLLVRALYAGTRIGFKSQGPAFNPQGKYVDASATSKANVEKKVQLFQSYPQIPADFWTTQL